MILAISAEQEQLRKTVRQLLVRRAPLPKVRELMETESGNDAAFWKQTGEQIGLQALAVPEEYGGAGYGFVEQSIVLEEFGAALYGGPYLASAVLAATVLLSAQDEQARADLLPGIASGAIVATPAFTEDSGSWDTGDIATTAVSTHGAWILNGSKTLVLNGNVADVFLVFAATEAGLSLFAVNATASGLRCTTLPTLDQTRRLARLSLTDVDARLIGSPGTATAILNHTLDVAAIALAAEQLGGARRALDMAVAYAKVRHQFGRPIGSFQAIKHRCADLFMKVETLGSGVAYGAAAVAEASAEVPVVAPLVKAYASETFFDVAADNIQIHGGIGFTWEHDAHLYLKRAKSSELFLGDADFHRERLAVRAGF
jgi:alkylation response protein AidB-like acyl-CoA dehydrogenase